jgi:hypothetical protein
MPIAFHVWNGDRGEVGQRRSLTTWYWLRFRPMIPEDIFVVPAASFAVTFMLLLVIIAFVRRRNGGSGAEGGAESEPESTPPSAPVEQAQVEIGADQVSDAPTLGEDTLVEPPPPPVDPPAAPDEDVSDEDNAESADDDGEVRKPDPA